MLFSGLKSKIILVLGLIVPIMGYALYHQIQANGALAQQREQLVSDLKSSEGAIKRLQEQQELVSAIVLKTHGKIRTITQTETRTRWKIREVVKEIEAENPNSCVARDMPNQLRRMFVQAGDNGPGDSEGLSADDSDPMD